MFLSFLRVNYFRMAVEDLDDEQPILQLTLLKRNILDIKVKVSGFFKLPTDSEILEGDNTIEIEKSDMSTQGSYIYYEYKIPELKKQEKIKYLVLTLLINEPLDFLSLYVYDAKGPMKYTIYDINYNKEEILNKTVLSQHKGIFIFILENGDLEKNKLIRVKINKEYSPKMKMAIAGFKEKPIPETSTPEANEDLSLESQSTDENYNIYEFPVTNSEVNQQKYLGIAMLIEESLDFISFYIGPES